MDIKPHTLCREGPLRPTECTQVTEQRWEERAGRTCITLQSQRTCSPKAGGVGTKSRVWRVGRRSLQNGQRTLVKLTKDVFCNWTSFEFNCRRNLSLAIASYSTLCDCSNVWQSRHNLSHSTRHGSLTKMVFHAANTVSERPLHFKCKNTGHRNQNTEYRNHSNQNTEH